MAAVGAALSHLANVGQMVEIGQATTHQREQIQWTKRAYELDTQSLRLDLLSSGKDEIRAHYETYAERLNTLLVVDALLWPFALASLQWSDEFFPQNEELCPDCIESMYPSIFMIWALLIGLILIMPFWSILMLIRCKGSLDSWLEFSLASLNRERRSTVALYRPEEQQKQEQSDTKADEARLNAEMEMVVSRLGGFIVEYQDNFARVWNLECRALAKLATLLLWLSALAAISVSSLMMWIYLMNRQGKQHGAANHFAIAIGCGFLTPAVYVVGVRLCKFRESMWDLAIQGPRTVPQPLVRGVSMSETRAPAGGPAPARRASAPLLR